MWAFLQAVHCVTFQLMSWQSRSQWWCFAKLVAERNEMKYEKTREGTMGKPTSFWRWRENRVDPACLDEYAVSLEKERWSNSHLGPTTSLSILRIYLYFLLLPKLLPHLCGQMSHLDFLRRKMGTMDFFRSVLLCLTISCSWVLLLGLDVKNKND